MPHCRTFGLVLAFVVSFSAHAAGEGIRWEVHNRFPLLESEHFDRIKEQWKRLPPGEQTMWHFIRARMEEKGLGSGKREFLLAPPPDSSSATGAAADGLRTPEVAVLLGMEGSNCQWAIEPAPAGAPEQGKCNTTMIIPVDTPFKVTAKRASMHDAVVEVRVREIVIVAMGDSYASGEGSPDRPAIYPTNAKTPLANEWFMRGLREDGEWS